jgi:hypothetical protein
VLPRLSGADARSAHFIEDAAYAVRRELEEEDAALHPWKKTMDDMRSLATALEARATDENSYPNVSFAELEPLIVPTYLRLMPETDAWGTPFRYVGGGEQYRFISAGADRRFEFNSDRLDPNDESRLMNSLDSDIIFQDGDFVQAPEESAEP